MPSMAQARGELKKYKNKLQPQLTDKVKRAVEVALGKITLQKLEATRPEPKYTFVQRQKRRTITRNKNSRDLSGDLF